LQAQAGGRRQAGRQTGRGGLSGLASVLGVWLSGGQQAWPPMLGRLHCRWVLGQGPRRAACLGWTHAHPAIPPLAAPPPKKNQSLPSPASP
jgi:hypothetical protein